MNPVQELLQFLDESGPGQYVVITGELAKIFPPPFRFKYAEYAARIKSFLLEVEREQLIRLEIPNKALFESAFGDLNNVYCDLENHEVKAKITKEGFDYLAGMVLRSAPRIVLGDNAQVILNSPGANNVRSVGLKKKANELVGFLKALADSLDSLQKIVVVVLFLLGLWGTRLILHRSNVHPATGTAAKMDHLPDSNAGHQRVSEP